MTEWLILKGGRSGGIGLRKNGVGAPWASPPRLRPSRGLLLKGKEGVTGLPIFVWFKYEHSLPNLEVKYPIQCTGPSLELSQAQWEFM